MFSGDGTKSFQDSGLILVLIIVSISYYNDSITWNGFALVVYEVALLGLPMHFVGLQYGRWQVQDLELGILKSLVSMV
jgi:hypothetical protein